MRSFLAVSLLAALTTTSFADELAKPTTIEGDDAQPLIRALSLTNLKVAKDKTKRTWTAKLLSCTTKTVKDPWELPVTSCDADGKKITGAAAVLLEEAMNAAKIPAPYMMAMKQIRAASLTCVLDEHPTEHSPFMCSYTPVGRA